MAANPGVCAACGFSGDTHEHHIVPRVQGGATLPTVYLCVPCHATVHTRRWDPKHVVLTRAGLAAAKARGTKLGGHRAGAADISQYQADGAAAAAARAAERLADVADDLRGLRDEGLSLNAMARRLNEMGILASRGGRWDATQVRRALARIA